MQNKIKYLRLILTEKCNLSCSYCHKEGCIKNNSSLHQKDIIKLIRCFYRVGINKFKFMGGEPTLREDLVEIIDGIKDLKDIDTSIITNGLFDIRTLEKCFRAGLKRVNVSVHAWNNKEKLKSIGMTKEKREKFLSNLHYLIQKKKLSKLNYVFLRNDDKREIIELINWINQKKLVLDILNVLYNDDSKYLKNEYCSFEEIHEFLKENFNFKKKYIFKNFSSIPSERIELENGGTINLKINMLNQINPFISCKTCNIKKYCKEGIKAIRLTTDGYLKPCLFREDNKLRILDYINKSEEELENIILDYINKL